MKYSVLRELIKIANKTEFFMNDGHISVYMDVSEKALTRMWANKGRLVKRYLATLRECGYIKIKASLLNEDVKVSPLRRIPENIRYEELRKLKAQSKLRQIFTRLIYSIKYE